MDKKRAGRPKKEEKLRKSEGVRVRLTSYEHQILKEYAEKEGYSMSELIRNKAIEALKYDAKRMIERENR